MFLQVSVILFTGGLPGPGGGRSGGAWSQGGVPGPAGGCLVPGGLLRGMPGGDPPDSYCCGRYESYFNAFVFFFHFHAVFGKSWSI